MDEFSALEKRVSILEDTVEALSSVIRKLLNDMYEPEFVEKIDKLVNYGKEK